MITFPIDVAVLVALGITSIIASSLVLYVMIGHVNQKLPEDQQIPYFFSFSYSYVLAPIWIIVTLMVLKLPSSLISFV